MTNPTRQNNQAHLEFSGDKDYGEQEILLDSKEIGMLHTQSDNPDAEFDITIEDSAGNEQLSRKGCKNPTGRWGERVDLQLTDSYYKIKLANVKNAKSIDIFAE